MKTKIQNNIKEDDSAYHISLTFKFKTKTGTMIENINDQEIED